MTTTPNMGLEQPTPGSLGPTWATDLNANSSIIDTHDHTSGKGVRITPAGLNVNTDLSISSFKLTSAKSVRFVSQSASLAESGAADVYVKDGNLFFASGASDVQLTNGGSIAGASGSIAGLVSPASAVFAGQQFSFFYNSGTYADLRCRDLTLSTNGVSGNTVKLTQAATATYTLTLPASPPSTAVQLVGMDTTGTLSAPSSPTLGAASSVLTWAGTTQSTAIGNGSVVIAGGVSIAKALRADSCRISNGLSVTSGGLGVDANGATITGPTTLTGTVIINGDTTINGSVSLLNDQLDAFNLYAANNIFCTRIRSGNALLREFVITTAFDGSGRFLYVHTYGTSIVSVRAFVNSTGSTWRSLDAPSPFGCGGIGFSDSFIFGESSVGAYAGRIIKIHITKE